MLPLNLIKHAVEAQNNAQAKYSKFYVGCALLSDNDSAFMIFFRFTWIVIPGELDTDFVLFLLTDEVFFSDKLFF